MRKLFLIPILLVAGIVGGCGSELANIGGGIAAGGALSNTIAGAEKDLEVREAKLVELYNQGVENGAQKEYLDQIEKDIYDTRLGKQTVKTGKQLLGIDWKDPKQTGGGIGLIATLVYGYIKRKELLAMAKRNTGLEKGLNRIKGEAEPALAKSIHDTMKIYT